MQRRAFLRQSALTAAALLLPRARAQGTPGHFKIRRFGDRTLFTTPEGAPFFSLALNHIDSSPLRSLANGRLWTERYGNSHERWLRDGSGSRANLDGQRLSGFDLRGRDLRGVSLRHAVLREYRAALDDLY